MKKIIMKINIINKKNIIKVIILFSYLICWLSISTSFKDLLINFETQFNDIFIIINFLRHLSIYLFFFICSFLIIFQFKFIKFNFKQNIIYLMILIYFLLQIPGLILTGNDVQNISFVISSLTVLLTIILIENFYTDNEKKNLIYFILVLLSTVFVIKFIPDFINFLNGNYTLYGSFEQESKSFLRKAEPRSSGISRNLLIIIIFAEALGLKKKINKYVFETFKICFFTIIFLFQSRIIIFLSILYLILSFLFNKKLNMKNLLIQFFKYLAIPIFLFFILMNNFTIQQNKNHNNNLTYNIIENVNKNVRSFDTFSSGRLDDWYKLFNNFNYKQIFGYGAQGDRFLIKQTASNGVLYAISSSGFLGLLFFLSFSLYASILSIKNIIKGFYLQNDYIFYTNLMVIIILLRSLLESGYAVFGIDYIVLVTCLTLINDKNLKN